MLDVASPHIDSVAAQQRANRRSSRTTYLVVVVVGLLLGLIGLTSVANPLPISLVLLIGVVVAILARPITGVFLTLFLAMIADNTTMQAYPFNLNFSSRQSFLYLHDALTFSPLELCLALTALSWFVHLAGERRWNVWGRPLLKPLLVFGSFVFFGLFYGLFVKRGDLTAAFWEVRPLFYLIGIYVLASNLFTRTRHYLVAAWLVVLAVAIQNVFALWFFVGLSEAQRETTTEGLTDHPASLIYGWIFLLTMSMFLFRKTSRAARAVLLVMCIPTVVVFVLSQRRAAMVALVGGFAVIAVVLFFRRRKAFMVTVPFVLVLTAGYTTVFWNTTDGFGFGAQAIKTVIAPGSVTEKDASSDAYRDIENFDLQETIKATKFTGVGFGKPFYRPAPLPNISFFEFFEYIPHNSIIWIWLKVGYFGFVCMLFVLAATLRSGIRSSLLVPDGTALAVTVAAVAFVAMFIVFAWVDIAWGPPTCVFLGMCIATSVNMLRLSREEQGLSEDDDGTSTAASPPPRRPVRPEPATPVSAEPVPVS